MAVGDFTINLDTKTTKGRFHSIGGTIEVDDTLRAFDIFPYGYIIDFDIIGFDDAGSGQIKPNENASGTADNGNVAIAQSVASVDTFNWVATYID